MELEMGKTTQKTQSQPRLAVRSKAREDKRGDRVADDASFLGVASGVSTTTGGVYLHPTALCESSRVGGGTRVWAFAHVLDGAIIGRNCNIGDHAYVEGGVRMGDGVIVKNGVMLWDGVTLEDYVFVGPGAVFTNDRYPRSRHLPEAAERYNRREQWTIPTVVRRGASIGAGAVILCGVTIGSFATVAGRGRSRPGRGQPRSIGRVGLPVRSDAGWHADLSELSMANSQGRMTHRAAFPEPSFALRPI
jgi:acetyltransferase-like isoleucine patch superfamily enzyme